MLCLFLKHLLEKIIKQLSWWNNQSSKVCKHFIFEPFKTLTKYNRIKQNHVMNMNIYTYTKCVHTLIVKTVFVPCRIPFSVPVCGFHPLNRRRNLGPAATIEQILQPAAVGESFTWKPGSLTIDLFHWRSREAPAELNFALSSILSWLMSFSAVIRNHARKEPVKQTISPKETQKCRKNKRATLNFLLLKPSQCGKSNSASE